MCFGVRQSKHEVATILLEPSCLTGYDERYRKDLPTCHAIFLISEKTSVARQKIRMSSPFGRLRKRGNSCGLPYSKLDTPNQWITEVPDVLQSPQGDGIIYGITFRFIFECGFVFHEIHSHIQDLWLILGRYDGQKVKALQRGFDKIFIFCNNGRGFPPRETATKK